MTAPRVWEAGRVAAEAKRVVLTISGGRGKVPVPGGLTHHAEGLDLPASGPGSCRRVFF